MRRGGKRGGITGKCHHSHFCFAGYRHRTAHSSLPSQLPPKGPLVICICLVEIPDQSTIPSSPCPPHGSWSITGEPKGGDKWPWDSADCPKPSPGQSALIQETVIFLECCNRGVRVFPESSTLGDPTLSPSSETQGDSHWALPSDLGVLSILFFLRRSVS